MGNFPAATFYGHDPLGSNDPDHFKVQDRPQCARIAQLGSRHAPGSQARLLQGREVAGRAVVALHPTNGRADHAARKLENIECRRIPNTSYFRSPYLRLVSTQTGQARRPQQTLLMMDYFDEGPANYQKHYAEILHQKVEATTPFPACPVHKCVATRTADLDATLTLHMAVHIVQGNGVTENDARRNIYTWTRRVLAPRTSARSLSWFTPWPSRRTCWSSQAEAPWRPPAAAPPAAGTLQDATPPAPPRR